MPVAAISGRVPFKPNRGEKAMDDTVCPEPGCDLRAEILDRRILKSTDGPIEHSRITCVGGHRFLMPTPMLPKRQHLFAIAAATPDGLRWLS
jgi:hypothetical protein